MKQNLKHKLFALLLLGSILWPMAIGFAHALEKHETLLCLAEVEHHIHQSKHDCDHLHYFSAPTTLIFSTDKEATPTYYSHKLIDLAQNLYNKDFTQYFTTRGPPN